MLKLPLFLLFVESKGNHRLRIQILFEALYFSLHLFNLALHFLDLD